MYTTGGEDNDGDQFAQNRNASRDSPTLSFYANIDGP